MSSVFCKIFRVNSYFQLPYGTWCFMPSVRIGATIIVSSMTNRSSANNASRSSKCHHNSLKYVWNKISNSLSKVTEFPKTMSDIKITFDSYILNKSPNGVSNDIWYISIKILMKLAVITQNTNLSTGSPLLPLFRDALMKERTYSWSFIIIR